MLLLNASVKINTADCVRLTQGGVSANTTVSGNSRGRGLSWDTAYDLWG